MASDLCCKQKMEIANFRLFAANRNRKRKFVFFGRQEINGTRKLLFQQTCLSMHRHRVILKKNYLGRGVVKTCSAIIFAKTSLTALPQVR
jgi:hypothetical protein